MWQVRIGCIFDRCNSRLACFAESSKELFSQTGREPVDRPGNLREVVRSGNTNIKSGHSQSVTSVDMYSMVSASLVPSFSTR